MKESQNIEYKENWRDEYLKWICGFANADGGKLYIGINDAGEVTGIQNSEKLLDEIPNKIKNFLGLVLDVNLLTKNDLEYIEIIVEPYPFPVNYKGQYHYRSGSTKQELMGTALDNFLLRKQGKHWDSVPIPYVSINDLQQPTFEHFRKKAVQSNRLDNSVLIETNLQLLEKLHLTESTYLTRAAILLFHADPEKYITGACVKIGYFETDDDLLFQDVISGNLFEQVEKTMDLLLTKYLKAYIRYEHIYRHEEYRYPKAALREAVVNAVVHKDYSSGNPVQISVYKDKIIIWNEGQLPQNWTVERLKQKHSSVPFNPKIASTFFRAGIIEAWGRGTLKIINECLAQNLPEPVFEYEAPGFQISFSEPSNSGSVRGTERMSERMSERIIELIKKNNKITIKELVEEIEITQRTIERYLKKLQQNKKLQRIGGRRYGYWQVIE